MRRVHRQLKVTMPSPAEPSPVIQSAIAAIEAAFADVRLGSGVSIRQADAIDNYDGEEEQALARELDEHEDWNASPRKSSTIRHRPCVSWMSRASCFSCQPACVLRCVTTTMSPNCSADAAYNRVTDPGFIRSYKPRMTEQQQEAIVLFLRAYGELEPVMIPTSNRP